MISIEKINIQSIPSLIVSPHENRNKALPLVIYYHGFTSAKEHNLPLAFLLAEKNYRVVLPDALYHGEREESLTAKEKQALFWKIVEQNVKEMNKIKKYFQEKNLLQEDRIGVSGTSMGGITTSAALATYSWVRVGAILMGTPELVNFAKFLVRMIQEKEDFHLTDDKIEQTYKKIKPYDLSQQVELLKERPLFIWHGEEDKVIPFHFASEFYKKAKHTYKNKSHIHLVKEKNRDHKVSRRAILETVQWFVKFL